MDEKNRKYEASFILEDETGGAEVAEILKKYGVKILSENRPAKIRLAYPIKKRIFGVLGRIVFMGDAGLLSEIKSDLEKNGRILRSSIFKSITKSKEIRRKRGAESGSAGELDSETRGKRELPEIAEAKDSSREIVEKRSPSPFRGELSNEALEKKLEEILKE